jgi:hypothetical protein
VSPAILQGILIATAGSTGIHFADKQLVPGFASAVRL